ncbi:MAG: 2-amino-4-hydroxy-6-hydroxymethyldihydropteridine diphosphokinase [Sphingopyxis sp.]
MSLLLISPNHLYTLALGSNRPHGRYGRPTSVIAAAMQRLHQNGITVEAISPTLTSPPIGPSKRRYANAAALIRTAFEPLALLAVLKDIERSFGRRGGQRWGSRVLDLDIILWSGGLWHSPTLSIPHPQWRGRRFVTGPLIAIAPDWRDPVTGLRVRHIASRLGKTIAKQR